MQIDPTRATRLRGILYLIASVTFFGVVDALSKIMIDTQSFGQVVLARYVIAFLVLLAAIQPRNWRGLFQTHAAGLQIARALTPLIVGTAMVFGVKYMPLAEATTILFAGPFFVVAFSGWMLGERVGAISWIGVAIGFASVLMVARPGFSELSAYAIFPAIGALFYAALQLLSRHLGNIGEKATTTLAWTLAVGTLIALPMAAADWRPMDAKAWILAAGLGATFGLGQYLLAKAFALAPANILAPFTYFQILSAVGFGFLLFGDFPDRWTLLGIALIVASGFLVFARGGRSET